MRSAIVIGGSIGGLFAAAALRNAGWTVQVHERVDVELAGRGAGIVTHDPLLDALRAVGASTEDLGVTVQQRVAFDREGGELSRLPFSQLVASWDHIHGVLRALMPDGTYHLGRTLTGCEEADGRVTALFADGGREDADLLVGADGFRSAVRGHMLPEVRPDYAGYVAWRAVAPENRLPDGIRQTLFSRFGIFAPNDMQVVGYPIAGPGNDLRPGHRAYNFVWYCRVPRDDLCDMLTDDDGRHHPLSIPPPLVREEVVRRMRGQADRRLPPIFREILRRSERPFFTPIYDHCSPMLASGRVALCGDSACGVRPHAGMGVTKAALDALALARHLSNKTVEEGLRAYSGERAAASRRAWRRARELGAYISGENAEENLDGTSHRALDTILRETAVMVG